MGLSRLSKTCQKCPYKNVCNNKRMEAFAYMSNRASHAIHNALPLTIPVLQSHDYRDVKIDKDMIVTIDIEDIKKRLNEQFNIEVYRL